MTHLRTLGRTAQSWVAALFVLAVAYGGASAQAGTATANMTVQITITASCTINAATLDFGTNPGTNLLSANVDTSTTVSVTCTNAAPYSIGMDNGANVRVCPERSCGIA